MELLKEKISIKGLHGMDGQEGLGLIVCCLVSLKEISSKPLKMGTVLIDEINLASNEVLQKVVPLIKNQKCCDMKKGISRI